MLGITLSKPFQTTGNLKYNSTEITEPKKPQNTTRFQIAGITEPLNFKAICSQFSFSPDMKPQKRSSIFKIVSNQVKSQKSKVKSWFLSSA
jgi:hypothetical protein